MIVRIRIAIKQEEYSALLEWAESEERNPEAQLRFYLRKELLSRGYLSIGDPQKIMSINNKDEELKNDTQIAKR